jgi:hypothetical protein
MRLLEIYLVLSFFLGRLIYSRDNLQGLSSALYLILPRFSLLIIFSIGLPTIQDVFILLLGGLLLILMDVLWVKDRINFKYFLLLFLVVIVFPSLATGVKQSLEGIENPLYTPFTHILQLILPDQISYPSDSFSQILIIITGYLFTLRESTLIVRRVLNSVKISIDSNGEENGQNEYNRGRIIGLLERTLVYFVVVLGQYTGIAIVVALKSIARFREFNDRNFAEYFLIGTLLSILLAAIPSLIVVLYLRLLGTGTIFQL